VLWECSGGIEQRCRERELCEVQYTKIKKFEVVDGCDQVQNEIKRVSVYGSLR